MNTIFWIFHCCELRIRSLFFYRNLTSFYILIKCDRRNIFYFGFQKNRFNIPILFFFWTFLLPIYLEQLLQIFHTIIPNLISHPQSFPHSLHKSSPKFFSTPLSNIFDQVPPFMQALHRKQYSLLYHRMMLNLINSHQ